jgi:diguanylate cyclase (GGDEF)-like protein
MTNNTIEIREIHWLMDLLQSIDVGLVVLDRHYKVQMWNSFMENHSGVRISAVLKKPIFDVFGDLPTGWLKRKLESVFLLENRAFTTWEQRPYLFKFKNYRPITGTADFMYQNITFIPLLSVGGEVEHVAITIYDVTDNAVSKNQLEEANGHLAVLSRTDRLTQLYNRGHWEERLQQEFLRSKRTQQPITLIMFDIDHFKKVNDTYGHPAGDEVIGKTAEVLRSTMRTTDIAGRYGGEEFAVILINTGVDGAFVFAERLRKRIEALVTPVSAEEIRYTVSLGIAQFDGTMQNYKQWLKCSDQALYEAKHTGRNRTAIYQGKPNNQSNVV